MQALPARVALPGGMAQLADFALEILDPLGAACRQTGPLTDFRGKLRGTS